MDFSPLKYKDDTDRAHGLAGMAIALVAYNASQYMVSISLDSIPGQGFILAPDFGMSTGPNYSAKLAWNQLLRTYELSSALVLANAMSRAYVGQRHTPTGDVTKTLKKFIAQQGRDCELEDDEIDRLYDKTQTYVRRLFTHPGVMSMTSDFVATILDRRSMTAAEILERLEALNRM
jgi:hypothetical protein